MIARKEKKNEQVNDPKQIFGSFLSFTAKRNKHALTPPNFCGDALCVAALLTRPATPLLVTAFCARIVVVTLLCLLLLFLFSLHFSSPSLLSSLLGVIQDGRGGGGGGAVRPSLVRIYGRTVVGATFQPGGARVVSKPTHPQKKSETPLRCCCSEGSQRYYCRRCSPPGGFGGGGERNKVTVLSTVGRKSKGTTAGGKKSERKERITKKVFVLLKWPELAREGGRVGWGRAPALVVMVLPFSSPPPLSKTHGQFGGGGTVFYLWRRQQRGGGEKMGATTQGERESVTAS